jgi:hypothetical protein
MELLLMMLLLLLLLLSLMLILLLLLASSRGVQVESRTQLHFEAKGVKCKFSSLGDK